MDEPWGISGPDFVVVYAIGLVVAAIVTFVLRHRIGSGPVPAGREPLSVEQLGYLAGGPGRMIETALAALIERNAVRVERRGKLLTTGSRTGQTELETAILRKVSERPGWTVVKLRGSLASTQLFDRARAELADRGLLLRNMYGKVARAALPVILVAGVGIARLVNGVRLSRPVGNLVLLLVVTMVVLLIALRPLRKGRSKAGDRVMMAVSMRQTSVEGIPIVPLAGAAALVAVGGLLAFPDNAVAKAFTGSTGSTSSSYDSSSSGSSCSSSSSSCSSSSSSCSSSSSSCGGGSSCGG
jgi:uncharacterized protein (TIGR04222 family)